MLALRALTLNSTLKNILMVTLKIQRIGDVTWHRLSWHKLVLCLVLISMAKLLHWTK